MIRIQRGKQPANLATVRRRELATLRKAYRANPGAAIQLPDTYSVAKWALWKAQHHKCCYCENIERADHNDVEHYRPKLRADRRPGSAKDHGYWWLAWTWENLLFACAPCNRSHKRHLFPLARGSRALEPEQQPPGGEKPLLIDPATEEPLQHLQFVPFMIHGQERWFPNARSGSPRGQETIRVLGLDSASLLDLYKAHVDREVRPKVDELHKVMKSRARKRVMQEWDALTHELLDPRRPFTALSYDALDHLVPEAERQRWGLPLLTPQSFSANTRSR
jgi:uncharacterized protein (TIGR02646 family)